MKRNNKPYGIERSWDSEYLCKKCGGLLYYDMETKKDYCFNAQCEDYPKGVEIFGTEQADLKLINSQLADIERELGQIISACDYKMLAWFLLERRRLIVQKFFTSGIMLIDDFLLSNEILLFIKKYKSLGIRKDPLTFKAILRLYRVYAEQLKLLEDLKEGRYLLARKPIENKIFRLKYYDVICEEIWAGYGLINIKSRLDVNTFRYHEVIQKIVSTEKTVISVDLAPYFDQLWPFAISAQYLVKRNYASSLKYQYLVTATDLANILSIIGSLESGRLISVPILKLLEHFIKQPVRDKDFRDFVSMMTGNNDKVPMAFEINGSIVLDKGTLLLFFILIYTQHLPSLFDDISGQERMSQNKQQASVDYENFIKEKIERIGYCCLPRSTNIGGRNYDVLAFSETKQRILLVETKFKDPSSSSFSRHTLIKQELTYKKYGLLPEVISHQERYDLLIKKGKLFQKKLGLKKTIENYSVEAYFVSKYSPLISCYGNVRVVSEKEFVEKELPKLV